MSDSCLVLAPYVRNSWDVGSERADTQQIPISEIENARVPNHSFERQALLIGIFTDIALLAVLVSRMMSGLRSLGT